ncbi:MAG: hypothetical protein V7K86_12425 [Nostoc sp.]|uniref:hypothetical protein n=1 Tax=Nostoc sp. TaxID=1180 RepID=UPI002FF735B8
MSPYTTLRSHFGTSSLHRALHPIGAVDTLLGQYLIENASLGDALRVRHRRFPLLQNQEFNVKKPG